MNNSSLKIALVSPKIKIADIMHNTKEIIKCFRETAGNGCKITVFPELTMTGATCGDLFLQKQLYLSNLEGIKKIISASEEIGSTIIFGSYLEIEDRYYDCIFIVESGALMGVVPKMEAVNHSGIDFSRWFRSGCELEGMSMIDTELSPIPVAFGDIVFEESKFALDIMIKNGSDIFFHDHHEHDIEFEEDINPMLIINPAADSTQIRMNSRRPDYYNEMSKKNNCAYAYVSPGVYESTTDLVFSGQSFAVSAGEIIMQSPVFERKSTITYADIDKSTLAVKNPDEFEAFLYEDFMNGLFADKTEPLPFIPKNKDALHQTCADAFAIQSAALATRLEHVGSDKALVGVSGGLDSTLALLVTVEAFELIDKNPHDIMTITMPGFGTSDRTFDNAHSLMELLGTDIREISIVDSVKQHFADIGHDINEKNKAYENAQARERTQILMDIANDVNGIVVGTGDLSESALGWCTYGGDHLAMYGVNESIPKTFIPYILEWIADNKKEYTTEPDLLSETLRSVIETPISPELLPADEKGEIAQKTEDSVGPYELHDYYLYHTMLNKTAPADLLNDAEKAFSKVYDRETIKKWLKVFYSRFFSQQFKRNCSVEGPMVTHISLSPRGGLTMPSDAVVSGWIKALD